MLATVDVGYAMVIGRIPTLTDATLLLVFWMSLGTNAYGQSIQIPLIDAHTQIDCTVPESLVVDRLTSLGIARALISIRGCSSESAAKTESRVQQWMRDHPHLISALISTKVDGGAELNGAKNAIKSLKSRIGKGSFVGIGEVLITHAPQHHSQLDYDGLEISVFDERVKVVIDLARQRHWPVTLHIELNDISTYGKRKPRTLLEELRQLLQSNRDVDFGLIHLGQANAEIASQLIDQNANVFLLTSTADPVAAAAVRGREGSGGSGQTGWINMFDGNKWKSEWLSLITKHPDRFVLAFDNVFKPHWEITYEKKVSFWRQALAQLPTDIALQIACANASRLWSLDVDCSISSGDGAMSVERPRSPKGETADQVVGKFDSDGDGKVSRSEFRGPPQAFSKVDKDGDGFLTAAEFEAQWPTGR